MVFARLHQVANVPECPKLNANCLSRETVSPTSQPLTTAFIIFTDMLNNEILSPTGYAEWLCKMNVTAECLHSQNHGRDSIQNARHAL